MTRLDLFLGLCWFASTTACAVANGDDSSSATAGSGAGGSAGSVPVSGGATGSGGGLSLDGSAGDAPELTADSACAAETFTAEPAPLNLMVMMDRSCSMTQPASDPLWDRAEAGMQKFFADPAADGVGVALQFFPAPSADDLHYCSGDLSTPLVALDKLSANPAPADLHEQKLVDAMQAQTWSFAGTPLYYALYGALSFARVFATANQDEQIVVVLVTDGVPGESCDYMKNNNIPKMVELAKYAHDSAPSIPTFTIGLDGSQEEDMALVAKAGGGEAFFLGKSPNVTNDIFTKLDAIKQNNLGCTFKLPEAKPGKPADPKKVNVKIEGGAGQGSLFKVKGKSDCQGGGWYYDDEKSPNKVLLCPSTCQSVKSDVKAEVSVLIGCATVTPR